MKTRKIKRYRLGVSKKFPTTHPRKGEETGFIKAILRSLNCPDCTPPDIEDYCNGCRTNRKIHTIRSNYPLWEKRMKEVQAGRAVIELFYWEDKPYHSKQVVFATLDKDSGCNVQEIIIGKIGNNGFCAEINTRYCNRMIIGVECIAQNDGLSLEDFKAWFKGYDLSEPMAIIHFTSFRY